MGDGPRAAKQAKLAELERFRRSVPHVSQSGLSAVLKAVKERGLPELHERQDIRDARDAVIDQNTEYGPVFQKFTALPAEGKPNNQFLTMIHPLALLAVLLLTVAPFAAYVERLHDCKPSSADQPWNLILYSDEVTPGNQLAIKNDRKIQVVYYSFLEFGHRLGDENFWLTVCAKRSSKVEEMSGGGCRKYSAPF